MFWGLKLEGGKHYSQLVDKSFHISHATLAIDDAKSKLSNSSTLVAVHAIVEKTDYIICYLGMVSKTPTIQHPLNLEISEGEEIVLYADNISNPDSTTPNDYTVYLTGYFNKDPLAFPTFEDYDEEEEEDEDLSSDTDEDIEGGCSLAALCSFSESESDEDFIPSDAAWKSVRALPPSIEELSTSDDEVGENIKKIGKRERRRDNIQSSISESSDLKPPNAKKKKKTKKKETEIKEDNSSMEKKDSSATKKLATFKTKGGVEVQNIQVGEGKIAKAGKMVFVKYTGRLAHNNKIFDSNIDGKRDFRFRLGQGEVIKGWDEGIESMKVGGKRRLTIPPSQGYGSKGASPKVPPNSKLIFDVELTKVK